VKTTSFVVNSVIGYWWWACNYI